MEQKTPPVYDHNSIKTLSELEHIRQNRGMYIGDTSNPNHLIYELLDNSLDEANAKYANLIGIFIDQKLHTCTVSDNGRGIPIQNDTVKTVATKLFSGGKFDKGKDNSAYNIASGLHGIGLVAITALSDWVTVIIYRDNKRAEYKFVSSKLTEEKVTDYPSKSRPFATQISFQPSKQYFESVLFDVDSVRERMTLASVHIDHLELVLVVDTKKEVINCTFEDYFRDILLDKKTNNSIPIFCLKNKIKDEIVDIRFSWDIESGSAPKHTGCVNLLSVNEGTHINMTYNVFRNVFQTICQREKLSFLPQDCLVGFRCHTSLSLYTPEYTSQTKEKLSSIKAKLDHLYNGLEQQLLTLLDSNENVKIQLLAFFESYRKRLSASKNIVKSGREVSRYNQVIDSKLKDCTSHAVADSELFITEGNSASGSLIQCRDPKYHAVLGLKGKIPNLAASKKDFLKNKEVIEIINSLGTGIEPDFSEASCRYGKIIFATDADADGSHITSLLMVLFLKLVPGLIREQTKIYRAIMPLYGGMVQKRFIPLYSEEDLIKFKEKNPNVKIQRYKGLGEMNPDQLKVCLLDKTTRRLELIRNAQNVAEIFEIMTKAELKRNLLGQTDEDVSVSE